MRIFAVADSAVVDDDDGRFVLRFETDEGDTIVVNVHACAPDFYKSVREQMGPWVAEMESARHYPQITEADLDGYALDDPKRVTLERQMGEGR